MRLCVYYTGCDCNYDLCASQRKSDYRKWKFLDLCLYNAVEKLSNKEGGAFPVFSGLSGVKMHEKMIDNGFFVTYVSTSWKKQVSEVFMGGNKGMIIEIDKEYKGNKDIYCCDVSWISKFPDECEVLFARSLRQHVVN